MRLQFTYTDENNYSIGVVGTEDVDCEHIDLTYVRSCCRCLTRIASLRVQLRVCSDSLAACVRAKAAAFTESLLRSASLGGVRRCARRCAL